MSTSLSKSEIVRTAIVGALAGVFGLFIAQQLAPGAGLAHIGAQALGSVILFIALYWYWISIRLKR